MEAVILQFFKIIFFSFAAMLLISFTILTFVQAVIVQIYGMLIPALLYYFVSLLSLTATYWVYTVARGAFRAVEYSELK